MLINWLGLKYLNRYHESSEQKMGDKMIRALLHSMTVISSQMSYFAFQVSEDGVI